MWMYWVYIDMIDWFQCTGILSEYLSTIVSTINIIDLSTLSHFFYPWDSVQDVFFWKWPARLPVTSGKVSTWRYRRCFGVFPVSLEFPHTGPVILRRWWRSSWVRFSTKVALAWYTKALGMVPRWGCCRCKLKDATTDTEKDTLKIL